MNPEQYIPRKTLDEIAAVHPEGTRHDAMKTIALPLIGNGIPPSAVFAILRPKFAADVSDWEIESVIAWCVDRNPTPSGFRNGHTPPFTTKPAPAPKPVSKNEDDAARLNLAKEFLDGGRMTIEDTIKRSPVPVDGFESHAAQMLSALYQPTDKLNIVCKFMTEGAKTSPVGGGKTLTRDEWLMWFREKGVPSGDAGAWLRLNPCNEGSGKDGAIRNGDVIQHKFLLLESDLLPLEMQLALYARLKIPIAAIYTSGGKSAHAAALLNAANQQIFDDLAARIMAVLHPLGIDSQNKNTSRLSRLPGAVRKIGAMGDGFQRLLFLNPDAAPCTEETIADLVEQVTPPFVSRLPLRRLALEAVDRYEHLFLNQGKTGLRTGLATFDRDTGGLKKKHFIVVAAESNTGKSTLALNIAAQALRDGKTVALFTLEMDREEIFDMLISLECRVDRNVFNTGRFEEGDMVKIAAGSARISQWPLHVFDEASLTCEQINEICAKLKPAALDLIVVDYLQLVSAPMFSQRENREQQVAQIAKSLLATARENQVPLIALSQLNDEGKLRESRAILHAANVVFMLGVESDGLRLRITKGRGVPKKTYRMHFDAIYCRMAEESASSPEPRSYHD